MRSIALAIALLALSGCISPNQGRPVVYDDFPLAEYQALPTSGSGRISGQVFLKTRGGQLKLGAGKDVALIPATSYTAALRKAYEESRPIVAPDPRLLAYTRHVQADSDGNFVFTQVPAGRYYLTSEVTWEAQTKFGPATQGGFILTPVTVSEGQEARVKVTR